MSDFNEQSDIVSQFDADEIADQLRTEYIQLITMYDRSVIFKNYFTSSYELLYSLS